MSKKKTVDFSINLAPKDPFFKTPLGKTLQWALSAGRYIVIFTEIIVILSFISRFTLDRQITDLNASIEQKRVIIESFGPVEASVRQAQKQIEEYKQVEQSTAILDVFPNLTQITPPGIFLDRLAISQEQINLAGNTNTQEDLNNLITNLTLSPAFENVVVNRIESSKENEAGFSFVINSKLNLK